MPRRVVAAVSLLIAVAGVLVGRSVPASAVGDCSRTFDPAGTASSWKKCTATLPYGVLAPSGAYDPIRDNAVLFGGCKTAKPQTPYTHATPSLVATEPAGGVPFPYEETELGGETERYQGPANALKPWCPGTTDETWTWNGSAWVAHTKPANAPWPHARYFASMTWDKSSGKVLLFGGLYQSYTESTPPDGARSCWGDEVLLQQDTNNPTPPNHWGWYRYPITSVTDDPEAGAPYSQGRSYYSWCFDDTWLWDGTSWQKQTTTIMTYQKNPTTGAITSHTVTAAERPAEFPARFDASLASEGCASGDSGCVTSTTATCFNTHCSNGPAGLPTLFGGCSGIGIWGHHGGDGQPWYWDCSNYPGISRTFQVSNNSCDLLVAGRCAVIHVGDDWKSCDSTGDTCDREVSVGDTWTWMSTGNGTGTWRRECPELCPRVPPPGTYQPPQQEVPFHPCTELPINWNSATHCAPMKRDGAQMAYDSGSQTFVLFGGYWWDPKWLYGSYGLPDAWEWHPTTSCVDDLEPTSHTRSAPCWQMVMNGGAPSAWADYYPPRRAWGGMASIKAPDGHSREVVFGGHAQMPDLTIDSTPCSATYPNVIPHSSHIPYCSQGRWIRDPGALNDTWFWDHSSENPNWPDLNDSSTLGVPGCTDASSSSEPTTSCFEPDIYYRLESQVLATGDQPQGRKGFAMITLPKRTASQVQQVLIVGGACVCMDSEGSAYDNNGKPIASHYTFTPMDDAWVWYPPQ